MGCENLLVDKSERTLCDDQQTQVLNALNKDTLVEMLKLYRYWNRITRWM